MINLLNDNFSDDFYTENSQLTDSIPCTSVIFHDENSRYNFLVKNVENKREKENHSKDIILPEQYTFEKIKKDIFPLFAESNVEQYFQKNDVIINLEEKMSDETFKQRKTRNRKVKLQKEEKKKSGRKRKEDNTLSKHNKNTPDNIIKKIKTKILKYLLIFINKLIYSIFDKNTIKSCLKTINGSEYEEKDEVGFIKYLDYNIYVNKMKKDSNIKNLKTTLKDFLSNNVSTKFKNIKDDTNKNIIEELSKQNNEIFNFIFNLKLGDWLDVFLYKKEIEEFKEFGKINGNQIKIIMDSFQRVDKLLINLCKKYNTDYDYVSSFIYHMYNFERWFLIKIDRNKKVLIDNNNIINLFKKMSKNGFKLFITQK
jgi:hypothetical protein